MVASNNHASCSRVWLGIERALEDGNVDTVVHMLLLALGDPLQIASRCKREQTLSQAFAKVETLLALQKQLQPLGPRSQSHSSHGSSTRDTGNDDDCEPTLLSYPQLQMFALHRLQPESSAYNIVRAVQITRAPYSERALHWTIAALLAKHDVLRTVYDLDACGEPRQRVLPLSDFVEPIDSNWAVCTSVVAVQHSECELTDTTSWITTEMQTPFDLSRDAPVRVRAVVAGATTTVAAPWTLAVALHHIATDATSAQVLWRDVAQLYTQAVGQCETTTSSERDDSSSAVAATTAIARLEQLRDGHKVQYRDYAQWQRARIRSGVLAQSLQYWIDAFALDADSDDDSALSVPVLPFDTDRTAAADDTSSDVVVFQTTPALSAAFTALCNRSSCSLFIGLLAVFQQLLSRLAGSDDIVIGVPTAAARSHSALADVVGYFVNTLPIRIRSADSTATFDAFLARVRGVVLDAFAHMEVPLQTILEHVAIDWRHQGAPSAATTHGLYQVMFAYESSDDLGSPLDSSSTDALGIKEVALPPGAAKFDMMLTMRAARNSVGESVLEGEVTFPAALFHRDTVVRFSEYLLTLMGEVAADPLKPLHTISMLSERERATLLHEWGTPAARPSSSTDNNDALLDACLHAQVLATPHSVALRFEGTEWTYAELWAAAERVCTALRALSVACGDHVALFLDRGLEAVAAMLGVMQCHAVFVPLDTAFPCDRIAYMLDDSRARVVVTQTQHVAKLAELLTRCNGASSSRVTVLMYDDVDSWCSRSRLRGHSSATDDYDSTSDTTASSLSAHDTVAYMLYTSGSTGRPKGVLVTHANLLTTLRWTVRQYAVSPTDIFLQSTSSTLDGSLTQLFAPLLVGARAVITKTNGLHDLLYMRALLTSERITFCVFVPSYVALLLDAGGAFPSHVKHVVLAGEALPSALAAKFYAIHATVFNRTGARRSQTCLVNEYGPTEAAVTTTSFNVPCDFGLMHSTQTVPIGRPIDGHDVAVLDAHRRLVPVNVPGELYVSGCGVARGYWHRTELTAERFIDLDIDADRHKSSQRKRWYRTGDRVKWLATGELLFLGRTDAQIKLHGMRVELHEVRNALLAHTLVADAEVVVAKHETALVAFVVLLDCRNGNAVSTTTTVLRELRDLLADRLPVHMVPRDIRVVADWPRTPNGKRDVRALAALTDSINLAACSTSAAIVADHDLANDAQQHDVALNKSASLRVRIATEILTRAWTEALGIDDDALLLSSSFFALGGNSLTAIRVMALVKAHGLVVTLDAFFRCKTLSEMARAAAASLGVGASANNTRSSRSLQHALVPLNWKQSQSSLFIVHCADGTVWKLFDLASRLPFAVVGVQATGDCTADSIEALAVQYWRWIRDAQRTGPYALGGYSFGCRVAHAIARLAHAEGHALVPLTLFDGVPCSLPRAVASHRNTMRSNAETSIPQLCDRDSDADADARAYVLRAFGGRAVSSAQGAGQASWSSETAAAADDDDDDVLEQLAAQYRAHCKLDTVYEPYDMECNGNSSPDVVSASPTCELKRDVWLRVHLFKTAEWDLDDDERRLYRDYLGIVIDVFDMPGSHMTMLQIPHVSNVADAVASSFDWSCHMRQQWR